MEVDGVGNCFCGWMVVFVVVLVVVVVVGNGGACGVAEGRSGML